MADNLVRLLKSQRLEAAKKVFEMKQFLAVLQEGEADPVGAGAENGGDLPNEPVHSRQLGWIVQLKFERYFPYFYKIPSPSVEKKIHLGP